MTCHFIPSYLLQRLIDNAAAGHATDHCRRTLELDDQLRAARQHDGPPEPLSADDAEAERTVYTAGNSEELPGQVARKDGDQPTGDTAVDEAWQSSAQIWDLFSDVFARRSVDGNGTAITITVHYGANYDNAFWDGRQLVFGDGDGEVFERFTKPMDVMAHEFTHGVTEHTAALNYQGQSGALNESVSDVFAAICKQRVNDQTAAEADWLIGEGLFKPDIEAVGLRSMKVPGTAYDDPRLGKDPQVGSMADYSDTTDDSGGVHINSGIPNRAFCLAAIALGGRSWEQAGPIWYAALTGGSVTADTDFAGFARATVDAAGQLFGDDAAVADKVSAAWTEVGVLQGAESGDSAPTSAQAPTTTGAATGTFVVRRSGGIAGMIRQTEINLDSADGQQIRDLLDRVDFGGITDPGGSQPDRFSYDLEYGDRRLTVGEAQLPPELDRAIKIAFGRAEPDHG